MYMMLTDETNTRPAANIKFFIYGGLIFPIETLSELDEGIQAIRDEAGYEAGDLLKFDTRVRPEQVEITECTEAKRQVVELCNELGCKFIVHVILHDIIRKQDLDQQTTWAADYVIGRYNQFLEEEDDHGICSIDNLPNLGQWQYLGDKFSHGLNLPDGSNISLDRIKHFSATCVEASHANSAMDIVLGTFRYCVNSPANPTAASEMMQSIVSMMWYTERGGVKYVQGRGLIYRPRIEDIRSDRYRAEYTNLSNHLSELLNSEEEN